MNLRAVASTASAQSFGGCPPIGPRRVLVRSHDRAIDKVQAPVEPAFGVGLALQRCQDPIPEPGLLRGVEAGTDGLPRAVTLG